jgi:hypothetical protein
MTATYMETQETQAEVETDPTFDPGKHVRILSGNEYLDVKWRVVWFRQDHPDWSITTEIVEHSFKDGFAMFKASVITERNGSLLVLATGYGSETHADFPAGYVEKAETKAIGRALALMGYGTSSLPDDGERIADTPVDRSGRRDPNPPISRPQGQTQPVFTPRQQTQTGQSYPMRDPGVPATPAQVDLIIKIAARKKLDADAMEAHVQAQYGRSLADLTKGNASDLITLIKDDTFTSFGVAAAGPEAGTGPDDSDELADARF